MRSGDIIADRFEIERRAGSGGMGAVYRARDRQTDRPVALKRLSIAGSNAIARFLREAHMLADIDHPGIVRYVAHGEGLDGAPYIAMEWLEGETLAERLGRAGLTVAETVDLAKSIAEALSALHRRGVIHRDLKPGNVFLVGGAVGDARLFDFGIARFASGGHELTGTGAMIGTPGYMAPEQARGERDIDARADLFALGCVLFKCLTGRGPFEGDDVMTVLLKVVLEDPPKLTDLNAEIPRALADLVHRMIAKTPAGRPDTAVEVLDGLRDLRALPATIAPEASPSSATSLTTVERRVVCLVLARTRRAALAGTVLVRATPRPNDETIDERTGEKQGDLESQARDLRALVTPFGGKLDVLADGSILVEVIGPGAPTDLATRAARCALSMRAAMEGVPIALVAGRSSPWLPSASHDGAAGPRRGPSPHAPLREAIDRAVALVGRGADRSANAGASGAIRIDNVMASLLDMRFDVSGDTGSLTLIRERDLADAQRTLLGKVTSCVGREQELGMLDAVFRTCISEPVARAVLVTAPAGVGKSRLRYELLRRFEQRSSQQIWIGRGDPMRAGSPFGMLASALRRAFGIADGEPLAVRQQKLVARIERLFSGADQRRISELIGELIGVPAPFEPSVQLRAARRDPALMGQQMRAAWEDFLRVACEEAPVVLVLEDLHWGDLPTVNFVDAALEKMHESPFFVLALARPEVTDLFPKLWPDRDVQMIRLGQLTKKAAQKLVREALGAEVSDDTIARVVERASGNAFYLEELIRSVAEGKKDELPQTILAMAEARLERLDPEARRVLRAASVFGQQFWTSGVAHLLGQRTLPGAAPGRSMPAGDAAAWLESLARQEVITARGSSGNTGEEEFAFRHALVREAAYAMLTDEDRRLGHRLAGDWLEGAGLADAVVLAEHFERGGEPARAVRFYRTAAAHALEGNDFEAVRDRVKRAIACGASGEPLGALHVLDAEALRWRGQLAEAQEASERAMSACERGSDTWFSAASELAITTAVLGRFDRLAVLGRALLEEDLQSRTGAAALASANVAVRLFYAGHTDLADVVFTRLERVANEVSEEPAVMGAIEQARAYRAHAQGDLSALVRYADRARRHFEAAGALRNAVQQLANVGYGAMELGDDARAEQALTTALADSERLGIAAVTTLAKHNLGLCLARRGAITQAITMERDAIAAAIASGQARMVCGARLYLALILVEAADLEGAEAEARAAIEVASAAPRLRPKALAALARVALARQSTEVALSAAAEAHAALEAGQLEEGESLVRLVHAEALFAARDAGATRAISRAREALLERAAKISDEKDREMFLTRVPENVRTMELWAAHAGAHR